MPSSATWIGEKIPDTPGMPKDECLMLPARFSRILSVFLLCVFDVVDPL